ncbi:MAG: quinolinate synthase NadA [Paludibacteraceae bacterium]|nr:quinolinate synthase NadA [Paludibacteraceae bacterium]
MNETINKEFLISEINRLRKEKNALIMAHYYQRPELQDLADFVGDSLALAQYARKTDAPMIIVCGVHFMGETAKILCPEKKVLVPDPTAGCSLADSQKAEDLKKWKQQHLDYTVISYVNTSAAVKALTDIVVTSSNALKIVNSLPQDEKILFGPDYNLGNYINSLTGRRMQLWNGACHVHEKFSIEHLIELKKQYPDAKVLAHPECRGALLKLADVIGSTQALLKEAIESQCNEFIVATEAGILHKMQAACPEKLFIPVRPEVSESEMCDNNFSPCACNECNFMRQNTLEKLYLCLRDETGEIFVEPDIAEQAVKPIERMLALS